MSRGRRREPAATGHEARLETGPWLATRDETAVVSMWTYLVLGLAAMFVPALVRMAFDMMQGRSAEEIRSQRRGKDPEYDGHHDYLEEVETPRARFFHWVTQPLDIGVSFLGGLTVARWLGAPSPTDIGGGPLGVPFLLYSLFLVIVATAVIYAIVAQVTERKSRLYSYPPVLALFFFGFLMPVQNNREAETKAYTERASVITAFETQADEVRAKWREDLRVAGAHGAPGTEPPMLEIREDGRKILLTNISDKRIEMIRVARVVRDPNGYDGYSRCFLESTLRRSEYGQVSAKGMDEFELPERWADEKCASGRLEFQIGDPHRPEPSWWTDSALIGFDKSTEEIRQRTAAGARAR